METSLPLSSTAGRTIRSRDICLCGMANGGCGLGGTEGGVLMSR